MKKKNNNLEESEQEKTEMFLDKTSLFFLRAESKKKIKKIIRKSICLTIIFTFLIENISFANPDIFSGKWKIGRRLQAQPPSSSAAVYVDSDFELPLPTSERTDEQQEAADAIAEFKELLEEYEECEYIFEKDGNIYFNDSAKLPEGMEIGDVIKEYNKKAEDCNEAFKKYNATKEKSKPELEEIPLVSHQPPVTSHQSPVTSHQSPVTTLYF